MRTYKEIVNKIKRYYQQAYKSSFYPSFSELYFSKKSIIAYYGFLGDQNFGDEWVHQAAKQLFADQTLLPIQRMMPIRGLIIKTFLSHKIKGIVIGGGTLIGPKFWFEEFVGLKAKNKPLFVHGTGVHKLPDFNKNWNIMLKDGFFGGLRGLSSIKNLAEQKLSAIAVGDAAFAMFSRNPNLKRAGNKVLINLGTHVPYKGEEKVRFAIKTFIGYLINNGYQPVFYPFHSEDITQANKLKEEFPQIQILDIPAYYEQVEKVFEQAIFAVGERLHFSVMAMMSGCPNYAINYDTKHYDMLESLDSEDFGHSPDMTNFDDIKQTFENREKQDFSSVFDIIEHFRSLQVEEAKKFIKSCNEHAITP